MNILICGAGEVGRHAATVLGAEGHGITIIDRDAAKLYALEDVMDARTLVGDGTHAETLTEAGCEDADVFIAATHNDEINLLAASVASAISTARTIARVHHSTFFEGSDFDYRTHFGIDHMVCPEYSSAVAIARKLRSPGALAVEQFARGRVEMQQLPVDEDARCIGKPLLELKMPPNIRVAAVERKGTTEIAAGNTTVNAGDVITLVGDVDQFDKARKLFQTASYRRKRIMVMGGSSLAVWLCRALNTRAFSVRLFETDPERAEELSNKLDWITVLRVDPLDPDALTLERIDQADAFIAATHSDEKNILAAARAKAMGADMGIAVLERGIYIPFVEHVGIDYAFSPRDSAVSEISSLLHTGPIRKLGDLAVGLASVYEVKVPRDGNGVTGKPLKDVKFRDRLMVAAIQRGEDVHVPGGEDSIQGGDNVLIIGPEDCEKSLAKDFGVK